MLILVTFINIVLQDTVKKVNAVKQFYVYTDVSSFYLLPMGQGWNNKNFPEFPFNVPAHCTRGNAAFSIGVEEKDTTQGTMGIAFFAGKDIGGGRSEMSDIYGYSAFNEIKSDVLFMGWKLIYSLPFGGRIKNGEKKYCFGCSLLWAHGVQGETSLDIKVLKNDTEVSIYKKTGKLSFMSDDIYLGRNTSFGMVLLNVGYQFAGIGMRPYSTPLNTGAGWGALSGMSMGLSIQKDLFHLFDWHYHK
jgi:hypothetical protein